MTHLLYMQHWSKLAHHAGEPCPVGRSVHATVCLGYGGDQPQLLVTGGIDGDFNILSDVWLLDVETRRWREVRVWAVRSVLESGSDHYTTCMGSSPTGLLALVISHQYTVQVPIVHDTVEQVTKQ